MSYGSAAALQAAVYQELYNDPTLIGLVGTDIYDAIPSGTLPSLYVAIGAETVKDLSDKTGKGALHEFVVTIVTDTAGFSSAKTVGAAVSDALVDNDLTLTRGDLIGLEFVKAKAARIGTGDKRQINLTFRARISDV